MSNVINTEGLIKFVSGMLKELILNFIRCKRDGDKKT